MNDNTKTNAEPKKTAHQFSRHHRGDVRNAFEQEMNKDIVQIISADGWRAVYLYDDGELEVKPLVCWSVYDDKNTIGRDVYAHVLEDGKVTVVDTDGRYLDLVGILGPGERMPKSWKRQIKNKKKKARSQGLTRLIADKVIYSLCFIGHKVKVLSGLRPS